MDRETRRLVLVTLGVAFLTCVLVSTGVAIVDGFDNWALFFAIGTLFLFVGVLPDFVHSSGDWATVAACLICWAVCLALLFEGLRILGSKSWWRVRVAGYAGLLVAWCSVYWVVFYASAKAIFSAIAAACMGGG